MPLTKELFTPEGFYRQMHSAIDWWPWETDKWATDGPTWRKWIDSLMHGVAQKNKIVCMDHSNSGELMNVNYTFMLRAGYDHFPLICVEHEYETLGSKKNRLAEWGDKTADVEWAFWKTLSMHSRLSVLIAYPFEFEKKTAVAALEKMLAGYSRYFGTVPNCLVLLGFTDRHWQPVDDEIYHPYKAVETTRLKPRLKKIKR